VLCCLGLEATPEAFVGHLVLVFREVRRVLRDDATLWLNLGDSYASGGGRGKQSLDKLGERTGSGGGHKHSNLECSRALTPEGLKPKDLIGIPWRAAMALQADGWYLRSDIIWAKPNPMPESVTDRPTKAHEQVFLLTKSPRYFYDAEAVREPHAMKPQRRPYGHKRRRPGILMAEHTWGGTVRDEPRVDGNPAGRNLRTVWTIATRPSRVSHFAVMAPPLAERCIKAGTSEHGCCAVCGAPWARVMERPQAWRNDNPPRLLSWRPTCACPPSAPVPCRVLDPFGGVGTTAAVAAALGRAGVLCEPNERYRALVEARALEVQQGMGRRPTARRVVYAPAQLDFELGGGQ
jgi:DNA modification methylase